MYRREFKDARGSTFQKASNYENRWGTVDANRPNAEKDVDTSISYKSLKGLPRSGSSITPKLDPYTEILPGSNPYALLNSLNRVSGGSYAGQDNLDGGNVRQFLTSERSAFLHCFDTILLRMQVNYRYLPIADDDTTRGRQYAREMVRAISEITSLASATTYTSLVANDYVVESTIPYFSNETGKEVQVKSAQVANPVGLYFWLIYYQLILSSVSASIANFNKCRSAFGTMMDMSFNRETPRLNSFFGLLKKKSFLAQLDSLCYTLEGEYFDVEWMQQFNMMTALLSRRADAMTEPLLEIGATLTLPSKFTLKYPDSSSSSYTLVYDHSTLDTMADNLGGELPAPYTFTSFSGMLSILNKLLSVNDTLYWARNYETEPMTESERFNLISDIFKVITNAMNYFKPAMSDLRTVLDVLQRVSVNHWVKGVRMKVTKDTDVHADRYLIVEHIYQQIGGGSHSITWNPVTYRWSGHSLWNMYLGIPEYDSKSGGAFLSFSLKEYPDNTPKAALEYLPVAIHATTGQFEAVNRLGTAVNLAVTQFDPTINPTSARLVPLPDMDVKMNIPGPVEPITDPLDASMIMNACIKVFGSYNTSSGVVTSSTDIAVEPDNLCFVSYEVEDLSSDMITYARTKGPFVVNTGDKASIGFLGTTDVVR